MDSLAVERLALDRDRNLYIFDDTPDVGGLGSREEEETLEADPLGLNICCLERRKSEHCRHDDASSDGSPEEKTARARALQKENGPLFAWKPPPEWPPIRFGGETATAPAPHALDFPRLA